MCGGDKKKIYFPFTAGCPASIRTAKIHALSQRGNRWVEVETRSKQRVLPPVDGSRGNVAVAHQPTCDPFLLGWLLLRGADAYACQSICSNLPSWRVIPNHLGKRRTLRKVEGKSSRLFQSHSRSASGPQTLWPRKAACVFHHSVHSRPVVVVEGVIRLFCQWRFSENRRA